MTLLKCGGLYLAFATVLLQIAVYLQPVLPEQFHVAPVCMSIMHNLLSPKNHHHYHEIDYTPVEHLDRDDLQDHHPEHNQLNHQCQYCTVYGDLVLPFKFGIDEVLDCIQLRLSLYRSAHWHVYFSLQRLYLLPQGRAPPISL